MDSKKRNQIIKAALAERFGYPNVSVKSGTGTARHWVEVRLTLWQDREKGYITEKGMRVAQNMAVEEARRIVEKTGVKIDTYISDDGFDSEGQCLLIQAKMF